MKRIPIAGGCALLSILSLMTPGAMAQVNRGAPTREELSPPAASPAPKGARLRVEGDIERAPCPLADPAYKDIRVTLTHVTFHNLKGVSPESLLPVYRQYLGADRPVGVICEIRDAVATALRRQGYLAAVQVPTQQIENGEVRFEVLFGRLVAVRVRGDAGPSERLIASYLEKLTHDEVFNRKTAERYLLLARDLPGLDVRLALKSAGAPGDLYGDVTVVRTPVQADLNIQNLGSSETGRWGGMLRAQVNGITGLGDRTTVAFFSTSDFDEQKVLQLGHEFTLGSEGLELAGHFTYAWTHPDLPASADVLRARTLFANAEARYPFLRRQRASIWAAAGLDLVNQTVRFSNVPIARDRLRVGYVRLDGELFDARDDVPNGWGMRYSIELRHGLAIFDASKQGAGGTPPSRIDGDPQGTLLRGTITSDAVLLPRLTLTTAVRWQYSFDPLFAFEEFSAGNYTIGRGYDPGTLLGENGIGVSSELRLNGVRPFKAPVVMQPFAFIDVDEVWNRGATGSEKLASVGGGIRAILDNRFRLDLTAAVPVRHVGLIPYKPDPRLLVSFSTLLLPWKGE